MTDEDGKLIDSITDGDIQHTLFSGADLSVPVRHLLDRRAASPYPHPVTAPVDAGREMLLAMMRDQQLRQIPLTDAAGRVAGLVTLEDLLPAGAAPLQVHAVVMAGGHGSRLRPLTDNPKPMLPVAGRPLMERIVEHLQRAGVKHVSITAHYRAEQIMEHFGDRRRLRRGRHLRE